MTPARRASSCASSRSSSRRMWIASASAAPACRATSKD
jgi:hypothetical protein